MPYPNLEAVIQTLERYNDCYDENESFTPNENMLNGYGEVVLERGTNYNVIQYGSDDIAIVRNERQSSVRKTNKQTPVEFKEVKVYGKDKIR